MSEPTKTAEPTTGTTEPAAEPKAQTQGDPADLGDAGKKALDAERTARNPRRGQAQHLRGRRRPVPDRNRRSDPRAAGRTPGGADPQHLHRAPTRPHTRRQGRRRSDRQGALFANFLNQTA
jgi:hypothetical protein